MDSLRGQRAVETLEALVAAGARLAGLDTIALRKLSERSTSVQSWLAAFDIRLASAATKLDVAAGRPANPEPVVSGGGRKSQREAAAAAERARACEVVPGAADALAAGELGAAHVDALAAVCGMSDTARTVRWAHASLLDHRRFDTRRSSWRCKSSLAG